jgi:hypothetical protein
LFSLQSNLKYRIKLSTGSASSYSPTAREQDPNVRVETNNILRIVDKNFNIGYM